MNTNRTTTMTAKSFTLCYRHRGEVVLGNYRLPTRADAERLQARLGEGSGSIFPDAYNAPDAYLDAQGFVRFLGAGGPA